MQRVVSLSEISILPMSSTTFAEVLHPSPSVAKLYAAAVVTFQTLSTVALTFLGAAASATARATASVSGSDRLAFKLAAKKYAPASTTTTCASNDEDDGKPRTATDPFAASAGADADAADAPVTFPPVPFNTNEPIALGSTPFAPTPCNTSKNEGGSVCPPSDATTTKNAKPFFVLVAVIVNPSLVAAPAAAAPRGDALSAVMNCHEKGVKDRGGSPCVTNVRPSPSTTKYAAYYVACDKLNTGHPTGTTCSTFADGTSFAHVPLSFAAAFVLTCADVSACALALCTAR